MQIIQHSTLDLLRAMCIKQTAPLKLAFLGLATLDHLWYVNDLPVGDGKIRAKNYQVDVGGMATNAAITAKILGADVHLFTHICDDDAAKIIAQKLVAHQLHIENYAVDVKTDPTPLTESAISAVIIAQNGERMIINRPDEYLKQSPSLIDEEKITAHIENLLEGAHVLEVDTRWPKATEIALQKAREKNIPSVMDAEKTTLETLKKLICNTDFIIFSKAGLKHFAQEFANFDLKFDMSIKPQNSTDLNNDAHIYDYTMVLCLLQMIALLKFKKEAELLAILEENTKNAANIEYMGKQNLMQLQISIQQALENLIPPTPQMIAVTMAEHGVLMLNLSQKSYFQQIHHFDIYHTNVVDTNGAGDAFHGAFAWVIAYLNTNKDQYQHQYLSTLDFSRKINYALAWANYIAALKCQNAGRLRNSATQAFDKLALTHQQAFSSCNL